MIEIIKDKKDIEEFFKVLKKRGAVNSGNFSDTVKKIVADVEATAVSGTIIEFAVN